jgi:tRNA A-37 threonylcarbamoyl transferase component Bud32
MTYPTDNIVNFAGLEFKGEGFDHIYKTKKLDDIWYDRHNLVVLTPTIIGKFILKGRPILERFFNDSFIIPENHKDMLVRQVNTIAKLNDNGVKTKEIDITQTYSRHNLTYNSDNSKPIIPLLSGNEEYCVFKSAELLKNMHEAKVIWGDAWLGNINVNEEGIFIPRDFSLKPNPTLNDGLKMYKDFIGLFLSSHYRTGSDISDAFLEGYKPSNELKDHLKEDISKLPVKFQTIADKLYFEPVFGMNEENCFYAKLDLSKRI